LPLSLIQHQAKETGRRTEVKLHTFSAYALDRGKKSRSLSGHLILGERGVTDEMNI
jgi:hypothetical protein